MGAWLRRSTEALPLARMAAGVALLFATLAAAPAQAALCKTLTLSPPTITIGTVADTTLTANTPATVSTRAGFTCPNSLLSLLSGGSIKARMTSQNSFKLVGPGNSSIPYVASSDGKATATSSFGPSKTVDYLGGSLVGVLGLIGGNTADLPFYISPAKLGAVPAPGTYGDHIVINWTWSVCSGVLNSSLICVGQSDTGTGQSVVDIQMIVTTNVTMVITQTLTWDPVNKGVQPRAVPGSRRRQSITVTNPNTVTLDGGTLSVILPTPANLIPALDGDGTTGAAAITFTDGATASAVAVRYGGPADTTDDVDFSSDNGLTWTYAPTAGDLTSEAKVTQIRIRPRGAMAPGSSFSVSASYLSR